ncbi:hypothetical protein GCM10009755_27950 [Brevibacterium samyangense]|uniref:Uncharacterized protein n=1 Tax=Brevibacterium samyangense TaxID=366888 RepID=A0ABN2TP01_9MICO
MTLADPGENEPGCVRVESRGGLVEEEHLGPEEQHTREREALLLSAGQQCGVGGGLDLETERGAPGADRLGGGRGRATQAVADSRVLEDGPGADHGVLRKKRHAPSMVDRVAVPQGSSAEEEVAAVRLP